MAHHVQVNTDNVVIDNVPYNTGDVALVEDEGFAEIPSAMFTSGRLTDLGEVSGGGAAVSAPLAVSRTVTAATPLDDDGYTPIFPTDGVIYVDASDAEGGLNLSFHDGCPQGKVFRVVRLDNNTPVPVYFNVPSASSAMMPPSGLNKQGDWQDVLFDGTNWAIPSIEGIDAVITGAIFDQYAGRPMAYGLDPDTHSPALGLLPGQEVFGPFNDYIGIAYPGNVLLMLPRPNPVDATPCTVTLKNIVNSIVMVGKADTTSDTVVVQSEADAGFGQIEGADTYVIAEKGVVTFARSADKRWWVI